MTVPVQQSLAGFIASDADVSFTDAGTAQVRFRVGVKHWRREQDRTFTRLEKSFHDLLMFGRAAERAADRFRKGDEFVAHGYIDTRYAELAARPAEREVYVARKIGHDLARTTYDVDRSAATAPLSTQQVGQAEVLPAVGVEDGHPSGGPWQDVPPALPVSLVADRPALPRPGVSPGRGIGP